jgi:hypothetical protein
MNKAAEYLGWLLCESSFRLNNALVSAPTWLATRVGDYISWPLYRVGCWFYNLRRD